MANGDLKKLGTLYVSGVKQRNPKYPWRSDVAAPGQAATGDIPAYSSGAIEIRDSDTEENYQIKWREVNIDGEIRYICDRNILVNVSWDHLNSQNLVNGKEITIDGRRYTIRLLSGGTAVRGGGTAYYTGGSPLNNEWDRIFTNEDQISGLPIPVSSDLDETQNAADMSGTHNQFWNWFYCYSWCRDIYAANTAHRVSRGYNSARFFNWYTASGVYADIGFRPVLIPLDTAPLISDTDRHLGDFAAPVKMPFTVAEGDGGAKFNLRVYLNSTLLQSHTSQTDGQYSVDLTNQWATLPKAAHTIKIEAEDTRNIKSTRTWTFNKTGSVPNPSQIVAPANGGRVGASFYVEFSPGVDPDGDAQTVTLEISDNVEFINARTFSTLEKKVSSSWASATEITSFDYSTFFRVQVNGIELNTQKYIRIATTDYNGSGLTVYSPVYKIGIGKQLNVQTYPQNLDFQPESVNIKDVKSFDPAATVKVFACNNGNDANPTWEDMTDAYSNKQFHHFSNTAKTAASWAVAIKYVVDANDATGEISISSIGAGVN